MSRRFAYAIDKRYLPVLVPFGLRGSKDGVTLTDEGLLSATFGFFKIKTPLANVTEAHITRNYRWWKMCIRDRRWTAMTRHEYLAWPGTRPSE